MRFISIEEAAQGMILATDLFDSLGRLLVSKSTVLTTEYVTRLAEIGIPGVYIDDKLSEGIEIEPAISPMLRAEGLQALKEKNIDYCKTVAKKIVDEILEKGKVALDMTDLRSFDNYTFAHSVNVAVLACSMGMGLELPQDRLEDLVFAGLLHDIGKLDLPEEIINKSGRLSRDEFAVVKSHPQTSYDMIANRLDISALVKHAVISHHENHDGSGYPNGLAGNKINLLARILHVADVYDALVSKRPYKEPYSPFASVEILLGGKGTLYDPEVVDAFLKYIPIYPKGTMVTLDDGRRAIVIDNSGRHNRRPVLRTEDLETVDLLDPKYIKMKISKPAEADYFELIKDEVERKEMLEPIARYKVMVLDYKGHTYASLKSKLGHLYEFQHVSNDNLADGYIRKNGYPDIIIIDVDGRDMTDEEKTKKMQQRINAECPLIVVGEKGDVETIQKFRSVGINNYILKPYRIIYIQSEIRRNVEEFQHNR